MAYYPDEPEQERDYSEERAYEDAPSRLGQVANSKLPLSEQEKSIANLHATIKQLEQRLSGTYTMRARRGGILADMIRLYQMWLFIRMVEQFLIGKKESKYTFTRTGLCAEFCKKKKWFGKGKNYSADEALRAYGLAKAHGCLKENSATEHGDVGFEDRGFYMSSPTYLVNELAKSIASVSSLAAVLIAAFALYVSLSNRH